MRRIESWARRSWCSLPRQARTRDTRRGGASKVYIRKRAESDVVLFRPIVCSSPLVGSHPRQVGMRRRGAQELSCPRNCPIINKGLPHSPPLSYSSPPILEGRQRCLSDLLGVRLVPSHFRTPGSMDEGVGSYHKQERSHSPELSHERSAAR